MMYSSWGSLEEAIISCERCPRLVRWRRTVALDPPRRYRGEKYWARPLPGFGDREGRMLVVGLAPAAHGGNRTGRMFTGDSSGNTLVEALHRLGLANQPYSTSRDDGLRLTDVYLTAVVRCAPPKNRPTAREIENCRPYLSSELVLLKNLRSAVALGRIAFDGLLKALRGNKYDVPRPKPRFRHGLIFKVYCPTGELLVASSYHPSRQNTQTGRLTPSMLLDVLEEAYLYARGS